MVEDRGFFHVRMTYDQGMLELMSPSPRHERFKTLICRFVEVYTLELQIPIMSTGSMTCSRELLKRGLEADSSYYVQHEPEVRCRDDLDFDHDPPPDLAIEVEITTSLLNKLSVYAALKVPEVWRFDGKTLDALLLNDNGEYESSPTSAAFPQLPLPQLVEWIERRKTTGETALLAEFQQWVRENLIENGGA